MPGPLILCSMYSQTCLTNEWANFKYIYKINWIGNTKIQVENNTSRNNLKRSHMPSLNLTWSKEAYTSSHFSSFTKTIIKQHF